MFLFLEIYSTASYLSRGVLLGAFDGPERKRKNDVDGKLVMDTRGQQTRFILSSFRLPFWPPFDCSTFAS